MTRLTLLAALLVPSLAAAQSRWKEIGKTGDSNVVLLDQRSLKRTGTTVDAIVRVRFVKPKKMPAGDVTSSRTTMTLDCAKRSFAVKENVYYHDERTNKIFQRSVIQQPGFGPVMGGSMTQVVYDHLCKR